MLQPFVMCITVPLRESWEQFSLLSRRKGAVLLGVKPQPKPARYCWQLMVTSGEHRRLFWGTGNPNGENQGQLFTIQGEVYFTEHCLTNRHSPAKQSPAKNRNAAVSFSLPQDLLPLKPMHPHTHVPCHNSLLQEKLPLQSIIKSPTFMLFLIKLGK